MEAKRRHAKFAFTLAEVLITLAVIGIVAALTIPNLVQSYKKKVVETRLAKFYSTFNQAINLSQIDNGSYMTWDFPKVGATKEEFEEWHNKYFKPYIKVLKSETIKVGLLYRIVNYLPDGSLVVMASGSTWLFVPYAKDAKFQQATEDSEFIDKDAFYFDDSTSGTKWFTFNFSPQSDNVVLHNKGLEPYQNGWNNSVDKLKNDATLGCNKNAARERAYCAKWIQLNGWKIPDDYPLKF